MTSCSPQRPMRWNAAIGAIARCKRVSTGCGRKRRSVRVWRSICGVKPTPKAVNKPSPHCIVHGLAKPGSFTTVSKYGEQLGLVGTWWSGQEHRVLSGIDGVLLVVVIGDGKLVVPVDFAIRRPDPQGPGGPCRDKLHWVQGMLDGRLAAFRRRGVELPPPMVVADSWFSDSKLMRYVATTHQGTFLVEGKSTYTFALPDGRQVKGHDLQQDREWPWRDSSQVPGVRYARLRATSPTYGAVTLIVVSEPREEQFYIMCLATAISGPRLIRAWKRRHWVEYCFRILKHLLATGACQVQSEDAYYGHLVIRLMGCFVLMYTSRVVCQGQLTMEEIIFSLKHYWRFVDSEPLELKALSQGMDEKAA